MRKYAFTQRRKNGTQAFARLSKVGGQSMTGIGLENKKKKSGKEKRMKLGRELIQPTSKGQNIRM